MTKGPLVAESKPCPVGIIKQIGQGLDTAFYFCVFLPSHDGFIKYLSKGLQCVGACDDFPEARGT